MIHLGELLSAHLDGELSMDEARLVAGHLEVCGACRAEFDDLATARAAVRSLPSLEFPKTVAAPIQPTVALSRWDSLGRWAAVVVAVAAFVIGSLSILQEPEPEPVSAADLGAVYVARVTIDRDLVPAPRYADRELLVGLRGGE